MSQSEQRPDSSTGQELVPFDSNNCMDVFGADEVTKGRFWCSLVPKTQEEKLQLYQALNGDNEQFDKILNVPKDLVHVALQSGVSVAAEGGELSPFIRTVLMFADGTSAAGTSKVVARSIRSLIQAGMAPPYNPPLRIVLQRKDIGVGADGQPRNIITVVVGKDQPPASSATKKRS